MSSSGIKVFAPASVANLAVGYDILGLALEDIGDEVILRKGSKPGLVLTKVIGNRAIPAVTARNTASYSAMMLLNDLGAADEPVEMELHKNLKSGTGLGSSAASAVAGVFAVNEWLGRPLEKKALLKYATMGEKLADGAFHADNTAPSLLGGITLIRDNETLDVVQLPVPEGLFVVVIYPMIRILTRDSRGLLSEVVPLGDTIAQTGNLGGFISALYRSDFDLMARSLNDCIIEPQRKHLIPGFDTLKTHALGSGALGFSISGAGPSMFALCSNTVIAENIIDNARSHYSESGIECTCFLSKINKRGAFRY